MVVSGDIVSKNVCRWKTLWISWRHVDAFLFRAVQKYAKVVDHRNLLKNYTWIICKYRSWYSRGTASRSFLKLSGPTWQCPGRSQCPVAILVQDGEERARERVRARLGRAPRGRRGEVVRLRSWLKLLSFSPNLERLVLRCIDSYDSESRLIFQHFSRTTRSTILCTAQISKFQEKIARFFR